MLSIDKLRLVVMSWNLKCKSLVVVPQISPRNRQTNYPYGADAPKADIPGPYNNFRPRYGDPLPQHIRDVNTVFIF